MPTYALRGNVWSHVRVANHVVDDGVKSGRCVGERVRVKAGNSPLFDTLRCYAVVDRVDGVVWWKVVRPEVRIENLALRAGIVWAILGVTVIVLSTVVSAIIHHATAEVGRHAGAAVSEVRDGALPCLARRLIHDALVQPGGVFRGGRRRCTGTRRVRTDGVCPLRDLVLWACDVFGTQRPG